MTVAYSSVSCFLTSAVEHDNTRLVDRCRVQYCAAVTDRYLISVIIFGHFQRPSVAANLTIDEFVRANTASDGRVVVLVSDHKTGAQGPAQVALEQQHYKLFSLLSLIHI